MCGISSCARFPGQISTDFKKMLINLVPFPKLNFFAPSFGPLTQKGSIYLFFLFFLLLDLLFSLLVLIFKYYIPIKNFAHFFNFCISF